MNQSGVAQVMQCERCRGLLAPGSVVCPACGALVWRAELQRIADEAQRLEQAGNLPGAAMTWQQALPLLPPESQQYHHIYHRIGALAAAMGYAPAYAGAAGAPAAGPGYAQPGYAPPYGSYGYGHPPAHAPGPVARPVPPPDTWAMAILKTGGSMLISMVVYWMMFWLMFGEKLRTAAPGKVAEFAFYFSAGFVILILVHELGHSW